MTSTTKIILWIIGLIIVIALVFIGVKYYKKSYGTNSSSSSSTPVATNQVSIANFSFNPATITVAPGATVTWTNNDSTTHTVTSNDNLFNQSIDPGKNFSFTFSSAGTFSYHCSIHSSMTGQVIVQ